MKLDDEGLRKLEDTLDDKAELARLGAAVIYSLIDDFRAGKDVTEVRMRVQSEAEMLGDPGLVADSIGVDSLVSWNKDIGDIRRGLPRGLEGARKIFLVRPPR
jgi:hypothetical protein